MFRRFLNSLRYWRVVSAGVLVVACLFFLLQWKRANVKLEEFKSAGLSYSHPKTITKTVTRTVRGPERIVYRTISPEKTEETVIEREEVTVTEGSDETSEPIAMVEILKPVSDNRWLLSLGGSRFSKGFDDANGKMLLVGYGWKNRFDLQVGATKEGDVDPVVLATFRF